MERERKAEILEKAKSWMREKIVIPHVKNTKKLTSIDEIKIREWSSKYRRNIQKPACPKAFVHELKCCIHFIKKSVKSRLVNLATHICVTTLDKSTISGFLETTLVLRVKRAK